MLREDSVVFAEEVELLSNRKATKDRKHPQLSTMNAAATCSMVKDSSALSGTASGSWSSHGGKCLSLIDWTIPDSNILDSTLFISWFKRPPLNMRNVCMYPYMRVEAILRVNRLCFFPYSGSTFRARVLSIKKMPPAKQLSQEQ